jgi:glycosyltransferase involved in cell wall biosynthesis
MPRKKILFLIHELTMGGSQRVTATLANGFMKDNHDVHVVLFTKKGELFETLNKRVVVHDLDVKKVSLGVPQMLKILLSEKPDIVFSGITHVTLSLAPFIPFLRFFLKKTKFLMREVSIPSQRIKYIKNEKMKTFLYKRFILNFDYIVAQSKFMKEDMMKTYSIKEEKITVVNNPLNLKSIYEKSHQNELVPFNSFKTNLLATGRLGREKRFNRLLELMTLLGDEYHLHVIGKGAERNHLEEEIKRLRIEHQVTLHGEKKNPYVYMKKADMALLSSEYEGYPNVLLEANACGTFAIAFACPGVNDEIITHGVNGFLVEDNNVVAMAEAIKRYASMKQNHIAILQSVERYKVQSIVENYKRLWESQ